MGRKLFFTEDLTRIKSLMITLSLMHRQMSGRMVRPLVIYLKPEKELH
jgi:hypothetical protein